jgi:HEPN domain-containing protein
MDKLKQIEYWISTAEEDLSSAVLLISNNKILHGLFFCHLCIEKALKAHVVKKTGEVPPKIHNLNRLLEICNITLNEKEIKLIDFLMIYQLEGRYPDSYPEIPPITFSNNLLDQTKELFQCLKEKLKI